MTAGQEQLSIRAQATLEMGAPGVDLNCLLGAKRDRGNQCPGGLALLLL